MLSADDSKTNIVSTVSNGLHLKGSFTQSRFLLEGPLDNTGRKLLQTGVRDAPNQPNLP